MDEETAEKRERALHFCYRELRAEYIRALFRELGLVIECPAFTPPRMHFQDVVSEQMASDATILRRLLGLLRAASSSTDPAVKQLAQPLIESLAHDHATTHQEEAATDWSEQKGRRYGIPD